MFSSSCMEFFFGWYFFDRFLKHKGETSGGVGKTNRCADRLIYAPVRQKRKNTRQTSEKARGQTDLLTYQKLSSIRH